MELQVYYEGYSIMSTNKTYVRFIFTRDCQCNRDMSVK